MSNLLDFNKRVSFDVYASNILGNKFKDVRVLGFYSAEDTRLFNYDPIAQHSLLYPNLPEEVKAGVVDRYNAYPYYRFETASGQKVIIGLPFIIESTITASGSMTAFIEVANVTAAELQIITRAIAGNGFKVTKADLA